MKALHSSVNIAFIAGIASWTTLKQKNRKNKAKATVQAIAQTMKNPMTTLCSNKAQAFPP